MSLANLQFWFVCGGDAATLIPFLYQNKFIQTDKVLLTFNQMEKSEMVKYLKNILKKIAKSIEFLYESKGGKT